MRRTSRATSSQRGQAPSQQKGLGQQKQQPRAAQPRPQRLPENAHLFLELRLVLQHRKDQRHGRGPIRPLDAIGRSQKGAILSVQVVVAPLTGREVARKWRVKAQGGGRLPLLAPVHVGDAGVQAGCRQRQPGLGQRRRHDQRAAVIEFGARQQQVDRALQAGKAGGPHAVLVGALHRQARHGQEGQQHQQRAQDHARVDGAEEPHSRVKR